MARVKTLEDFSGKPAYMGVDVGKTSHWAYAVDAAGRTLLSRAVANDEADIRAALAAHGAAGWFAAVVGHADVDFAHQKPDPAAFLACLDHLGLREGRFAYIGDHAGDIAFGRNAQAALRAQGRAAEVVCVAAAWGGAPPEDLADADAVAACPAELPDILAGL